MDIDKIQTEIIGSVVGEAQFQKVKWLVVSDFDKKYQKTWSLILQHKGDCKLAFKNQQIYHASLVVSYSFPERLGLILLEYRFRQYVEIVLMDMITQCDDVAVTIVLEKALIDSKGLDVFDLANTLPEYIGAFTDAPKLLKWANYIDDRCKQIKNELN